MEQELKNDLLSNVDELDSVFTLNEVCKAISSLKRDKSGSIDDLIPEMFL